MAQLLDVPLSAALIHPSLSAFILIVLLPILHHFPYQLKISPQMRLISNLIVKFSAMPHAHSCFDYYLRLR